MKRNDSIPVIPPADISAPQNDTDTKPATSGGQHTGTIIGFFILAILVIGIIYLLVKCIKNRKISSNDYAFQNLSDRRDIEDAYGEDLSDEDEFTRIPPSVQIQSKKDYFRLE